MLNLIERVKSRKAIAGLETLLTQIEISISRNVELPSTVKFMLGQLTKSDSLDTQYAFILDWLEKTRGAYLEKLRLNARDSLSCFAEYINPEEPPAHHHEWMCQRLEEIEARKIMRAMFSMPPGHAKSTYCTHLYPAWYLGRNPDHKYIQGGHTQDFVDEEFGKRVRGIIDSEDYHSIFPDVGLHPTSKAASRFAINKHKGKYLGRGVGQGISGFRANMAAVDDPFASREDAESPTVRQKVYNWFMSDVTPRLLPRSPLFIVATRWHTDDLCGRLEHLNSEKIGLPWMVVNLPALAEDNDPLGREPGEPLWPDFYDLAHMLNLRDTLPPRDWNSLYQGRPTDAIGGTFLPEWIHRYDTLPLNETNEHQVVTRMHIRRIVISVDTASKTAERNDWTVITVWIEDAARKHYLAEVVRRRVEFNDMIALIEDTVDKWNRLIPGCKVAAILVEDKGSGTQYIQTRTDKAPAPIIPIEVGTLSKEFRFDGVTPMFEGGEVLLPKQASWLAEYEAELLSFPTGTYDDQVDSTSQYLSWARTRRRGGTKKMGGVALPSNQAIATPNPSLTPFVQSKRLQNRRKVRSNWAGAGQYTPSAKIAG